MTTKQYRRAFKTLKKEFMNLLRQREEIDKRIAKLEPVLENLAALCEEPIGKRLAQRGAPRDAQSMGITDAVRLVLKRSARSLMPTEVREELVAWGLNPGRYANLLGSIHMILKRLVKSGQAAEISIHGGKKAYKWTTDISRVLASLEGVDRGIGSKE